jgi:serine/threonine protein phosphatase PrpC
MTWRFDLATAIGGRAEQQDRSEVFALPGRPNDHLVVLADGMGGQQHGALAAQTVLDTARDALAGLAKRGPREGLTDLCHAAHEAIRSIGRQDGSNPASTCTALFLRGDEAYWIHVGDSRLYHFDGDTQLFRTPDHTLASLLQGRQGAGAATRAGKRRNSRLYMCLGGNNELEPAFGATAIGKTDWFLLCSDGFWNQVQSTEAAHRVTSTPADSEKAADLVALAAQRGGPGADNVSLVLATRTRKAGRRAWWRP